VTPGRTRTLTRLGIALGCAAVLGFGGSQWWRSTFITCGWSEATSMLQSIRIAEESYRAEAGTYLGCDERGEHATGGDLARTPLFPRAQSELGREKKPFADDATALGRCFKTLNLRPDGPVRYAYSVVAHGGPEPWFEARAVGDLDGDGDHVEYRVTSLSAEIHRVDVDD
jgi:hypothetical protein